MNGISQVLDVFMHLDVYLGAIINNYGIETYLILFFIIFCETGLVVTPFLPGDSLIFASGAFAALGLLNIYILIAILMVAAILGDTVNYEIGRLLGKKAFTIGGGRIFKKEHIDKTNKFYEKYGGKTIIFARFIPIVRTFAPFVAGIGKMNYKKFISFNAIGGSIWVIVASAAGYFFGNIEVIKNNFSLVMVAIIAISILPAVIEFIRNKMTSSIIE
ncbi:DedA family protein [Clostridium uliginosum]|uniref:Membrane-associated protein n=1 Tax=Clostridium uliginosum TaxID=119641 RepID=A0A1I1KIW1_9CLOT|nr:DedA family protein [Clostridium uliginosum]SFC58063.1 membrane-associated protein [Clostridium uliginosum]